MIKQTIIAALVALSLATAIAATTSPAFAYDDDNGYDRPSYSHNDDSYGNHYRYHRRGYDSDNHYGYRRRSYDGGNNNNGYNNGY